MSSEVLISTDSLTARDQIMFRALEFVWGERYSSRDSFSLMVFALGEGRFPVD